MARHDDTIIQHLGNDLLRCYCKQPLRVEKLSPGRIREHLMLPFCICWKLDFDKLPSERTFYRALREGHCSEGMKEILCVMLYAYTDEACRQQMPRLYLDICAHQRPGVIPHWERYKNEYYEEKNKSISAEFQLPRKSEVRKLKPDKLARLKKMVDEVWSKQKRRLKMNMRRRGEQQLR
jgi:hypothetical protein